MADAQNMCLSMWVAVNVMSTPSIWCLCRFQSQLPHARKYKHVFPTLLTIAREEGPRALYRGFLPKAVRLGLGQSSECRCWLLRYDVSC